MWYSVCVGVLYRPRRTDAQEPAERHKVFVTRPRGRGLGWVFYFRPSAMRHTDPQERTGWTPPQRKSRFALGLVRRVKRIALSSIIIGWWCSAAKRRGELRAERPRASSGQRSTTRRIDSAPFRSAVLPSLQGGTSRESSHHSDPRKFPKRTNVRRGKEHNDNSRRAFQHVGKLETQSGFQLFHHVGSGSHFDSVP